MHRAAGHVFWTLLSLVACAAPPSALDAGDAVDAGDSDAATDADAGGEPDAGGSRDAGTGSDAGPARAPGCDVPASARLDLFRADPSWCASVFAAGVDSARGLAVAPDGNLFVVSRSAGILVLQDLDGDGDSEPEERSVFAANPAPNHGLAFHGGWLYASNDTTVWRWRWQQGLTVAVPPAVVVVKDLPAGGNHVTRTLRFLDDGTLLVSVGSALNVDFGSGAPLTSRALVRRFDVSTIPEGGHPASSGELFATGLRNEVGLTVDPLGRLWGVENGRDQLVVNGEDIHNDNPGEELHRFDPPFGAFYGYPYCWTEGMWSRGGGRGTQHVDPDVPGGHDDAWCAAPANVRRPAWTMPAHIAPLGLLFVPRGPFAGPNGALLVTSHGSWNRDPPAGRALFRANLDDAGNVVSFEPVLGRKRADGTWDDGVWPDRRPVDVVQDADGAIYVSDDGSGSVLRLGATD